MNHPLPKRRIKNLEPYKWKELDVGDSRWYCVANPSALRSSLSRFAKAAGREFTARTAIEDGMQGIRVWRLE